METFWKKTRRELYKRTVPIETQGREMTDETFDDTILEKARPWEEQWKSLEVNESKAVRKS